MTAQALNQESITITYPSGAQRTIRLTYRVWSEFPKGSWISGGGYDVPGTENEIVEAYKGTGLFEIISCERFCHRQSMAGEPIYNLALLARRS